jgi:hypothetical protein
MHSDPELGPAAASLFGQLGPFVEQRACCRKVAQARLQPGQVPQCSQLDVQVAGVSRPGSGRYILRAGLGRLVVLLDQAQRDQDVSFVVGAVGAPGSHEGLIAPAASLVSLSAIDERLRHGGGHPCPQPRRRLGGHKLDSSGAGAQPVIPAIGIDEVAPKALIGSGRPSRISGRSHGGILSEGGRPLVA